MDVFKRPPVFDDEVTLSYPEEERPFLFRRKGLCDLSVKALGVHINVFSRYKTHGPAFQFKTLEDFQKWAAPRRK